MLANKHSAQPMLGRAFAPKLSAMPSSLRGALRSRRSRVEAASPSAPKTAPAPKAPSATTAAPAPAVSAEVAADLYYDMVLGRDFEDMCAQMYYR